jgi:prepilin-type N-terminal cleavage/methylation domain-containing protein
MERRSRAGVTLIEVVVAILVLAVGTLALAGSAAVTLRRMSDSARGAAAASVARSRAESSFSRLCAALGSGSQQLLGVRSEWSIAGGAGSADISQRVTYPTRGGDHTDEFLTTAPCG